MTPGSGIRLVWGVAATLMGLLVAGCASYRSLEGRVRRPVVASVQPVPTVTPPEDWPAEDPANLRESASDLLEHAFLSFTVGRDQAASRSFAAAIATGDLNDAGRALAYWHIATSERRLDNEDASAEALMSFIVVGQDVLDARATRPYTLDGRSDFVENFNLESRLAEAKGYLAAAWARRVSDFGHSLDEPVVVASELEAEAILAFAPPCEDEADRDVARNVLYTVGSVRVERVKISCIAELTPEPYYIVYVLPVDSE
ncbi:MAG: hypothetical protein HY903_05460 [Deltaproteobacteria bacterium]|nr:hypothetical protein [Deltaproteobacteria bacterium]